MPGRAKSDTKKAQLGRNAHDDLMAQAVEAYRIELKKSPGPKIRGAHTICKDFEALNKQATGRYIKLSYSTLTRLVMGGKTKAKSNAERCWLTNVEIGVVIAYIGEIGNRGFPLSHKRLKEHVDTICRARLGALFPAEGVGKNWTNHFVEKHSDAIKMSWSRPLETKRGRAVNPFTKDAFYELLGDTVKKYDITEDRTWGVDEIGIQGSMGMPERVMGAHKLGPQYQQRDGDRENITVLETICADGMSIPPAVIFKGSAYQVKWVQDNPANAS
jgi:hypothetical protein